MELVIFDNSPVAHADVLYSEKNVHYHHDPANPGLAVAYNYAIDHISDTVQTLITLDQDTQLGTDYLETVAELTWTKERVVMGPLSIFWYKTNLSGVGRPLYQSPLRSDRRASSNTSTDYGNQFWRGILAHIFKRDQWL